MAAAAPRGEAAAMEFQHGVASGDPLTDRVVIWTRVTTDQRSIPVHWVLARDEQLTDVVARGTALASAKHDHTLHVDVVGLEPGTTYYYRFETWTNASPTGRTRTLRPDTRSRPLTPRRSSAGHRASRAGGAGRAPGSWPAHGR
jgi:alkaline phosphatase D